MTQMTAVQMAGLSGISLSNEKVRAVFLPELGGKMVSLIRVESGHEFLLQPQDVGRKYGRPAYGDRMENFDTSGFDECFPTVSACLYPLDSTKLIPDHGDLWPIPWKASTSNGSLVLEVNSRALTCRLRKQVRLDGDEVVIDYELTNESNQRVCYLWSAHPLMRVEAGTRINFPPEVDKMLVNWSRDNRLGSHAEYCKWPIAAVEGRRVDLSRVGARSSQTADKLFTQRLKDGWCCLHHPKAGESIKFRFDALQVPYIGLWMSSGGWPEKGEPGHLTVALEPCSGRPDALHEAHDIGESLELAPGEVSNWWLRIQVRQAPNNDL